MPKQISFTVPASIAIGDIRRHTDPSSAVHGFLMAVFGEGIPRPFTYSVKNDALFVAGYTDMDKERALRAIARNCPDRLFAQINWETVIKISDVPDPVEGGRYIFRLKTLPLERVGTSSGVDGRNRRFDCYLNHVRKSKAQGVEPLSREEIYTQWLRKRLPGAKLEDCMVSYTTTALVRGDHPDYGRRKMEKVNVPEAVYSGTVVVEDPSAFLTGVTRGIGTQKAFGYGMVLYSEAF